jgi:hypothetical protein
MSQNLSHPVTIGPPHIESRHVGPISSQGCDVSTSNTGLRGGLKRAARGFGRRLMTVGSVEPAGFDIDEVPSSEIALYFADQPQKLYQLLQWLPIFEARTDLRTIVVVRHVETYNQLVPQTSLQVLLVPRYEVLMALYDRADFHAVIYVNNGWTNFQSLSFQQAVHLHVNHGESDKICMVSNQAKAYDKVFVAGEAAVRRHAAAIAWFDPSHLVRVGRPQLDLPVPDPLPPFDGVTLCYAPTWEGEDEANNYTSLDCYGMRIIDAALRQPNARVLYKPHPRILETPEPSIRAAHQAIVQRIRAAAQQNPERGHAYIPEADILGVLRGTDLLIADVSSVSLDHLYLRPDAALALCDRRTNRSGLVLDAPIAKASFIVDADSIDDLDTAFAGLLAVNAPREERRAMRDFYFDGLEPGESTERFWQETLRAIREHDEALQSVSRLRIIEES